MHAPSVNEFAQENMIIDCEFSPGHGNTRQAQFRGKESLTIDNNFSIVSFLGKFEKIFEP